MGARSAGGSSKKAKRQARGAIARAQRVGLTEVDGARIGRGRDAPLNQLAKQIGRPGQRPGGPQGRPGGGRGGGVFVGPPPKKGEIGWGALTEAERGGVDPLTRKLGKVISARTGFPIEIISGYREGDPKEHGSGWALDIHALSERYGNAQTQAKGDEIAKAAVIAGGGTKQQAEQFVQNGGWINVSNEKGRTQVGWKTDSYGDHHNHVHVGFNPTEGDTPTSITSSGTSTGAVSGTPAPTSGAAPTSAPTSGAPAPGGLTPGGPRQPSAAPGGAASVMPISTGLRPMAPAPGGLAKMRELETLMARGEGGVNLDALSDDELKELDLAGLVSESVRPRRRLTRRRR